MDRLRIDEDQDEESLEDRRQIKAVLVGASVILFVVALLGWG